MIKTTILNWLSNPLILTTLIMTALSLLLIPFIIRFVITPLILLFTSRYYVSEKSPLREKWKKEENRELSKKMYRQIKRILYQSETFKVSEDIRSLMALLIPPNDDKETLNTLRLNFSPVRFLETLLLAYEDLHKAAEKRRLLRYLLRRRIKWFRPFHRGMKMQQWIKSIPIVDFFNKKGLFTQGLRLILIPVIGLPGLIFYALRSLLVRGIWAGLIRYYYTIFLLRTSYYMIYLYGGNTEVLNRRTEKFSRDEIIRKGMNFDKELSLLPDAGAEEETMKALIDHYEKILKEAGFTPDPVYTLRQHPKGSGHSLKRKLKGLFRRTLTALNQHLSEKEEQPGLRETAIRMLKDLPAMKYPGSSQPLLNYRVTQGLNVSQRLLFISLSRIYTNAPGSHFAMDRISVDLIRQAREFSRRPLISLLSRTGKTSYQAMKPLLQLRRINRLRKKTTPAGVVSLSIPFLGKLIQDRWKELILYRLGRAIIHSSLKEEESLTLP